MIDRTQETAVISDVEKKLKKPLSFSINVLNLFADACDGMEFKYYKGRQEEQGGQKNRVFSTVDDTDPNKTIIHLPQNPTLEDILAAASLIGERKERSTPLSRTAKQFQDLSIFLSQHPAFQGPEFDEVIITFFHLGQVLETKAKNINATIQPLSRENIQALNLSPPGNMSLDEYKDNLFLFFLGKNVVLERPKGDEKLQQDPAYSFYRNLYYRWIVKKGYLNPNDIFDPKNKADTEDLREEFDRWLIRHKNLILSLLTPYVFNKNSRTQTAVDQLFKQVIEQELEERLFTKGRKLIKEKLLPPQRFSFFQQIKDYLLQAGIDFDDFQATLFQEAEKLLQKLDKTKGIYDKIQLLRDLVYGYRYIKTFKISKAVEIGKFECNLKSLVLASLYERFLGEEIVVFADSISGHVRLIVAETASLNTHDPKFYFVDPTLGRRSAENINEITRIQDPNFINQITTAYKKNPQNIRLNLRLNTELTDEQYHRIGNWPELIEAGLWINIGSVFTKTEEEKRLCYRKALRLNPNDPVAWNNYGTVAETIEEARLCFRTALRLNPNDDVAWNNYGTVAETIEEARLCFRTALRLNPNFAQAKFNLAFTYKDENPSDIPQEILKELIAIWKEFIEREKIVRSDWVTENDINFAKQELNRLSNRTKRTLIYFLRRYF